MKERAKNGTIRVGLLLMEDQDVAVKVALTPCRCLIGISSGLSMTEICTNIAATDLAVDENRRPKLMLLSLLIFLHAWWDNSLICVANRA